MHKTTIFLLFSIKYLRLFTMAENKAIRETKRHGLINFPFEVYRCKIPETFHFFPVHYHEEFEIVYMLEGILDCQINMEHFICREGDILVIPPGKVHGFNQFEDKSCHYANILFSLNLLEKEDSEIFTTFFKPYLKESIQISNYFPKESKENILLHDSVLTLFEHRHEELTEPLLIKSELYKVMSILQKIAPPAETLISTSERNIKRLMPVFEAIKKNSARSISVPEAASLSNLSESYFMTIFKQVSGSSFINFLKKTRLENARVMLLSTDISILEIAENSGFESVSYFIRAFKEFYKISPLQYRKTMSLKHL